MQDIVELKISQTLKKDFYNRKWGYIENNRKRSKFTEVKINHKAFKPYYDKGLTPAQAIIKNFNYA